MATARIKKLEEATSALAELLDLVDAAHEARRETIIAVIDADNDYQLVMDVTGLSFEGVRREVNDWAGRFATPY